MAAAKSRSRRTAKPRTTSKPRGKSKPRTVSRKTTAKRTARSTSAARSAARRPGSKRAPKHTSPQRPAAKRSAAKSRAPIELTPRATPSIPNAIGLISQHLDFTSHDLDGIRRFYVEMLGFSNFHHDPKFDYLSVSIIPNVSIGFMPPMAGPPEQWRPPREPALYLIVDNVDRACAALVEKGVTLDQAPTDMPWGDRAAMVRDPEGRMVWLAQHLSKG